jgi:thioesterase domain-containing protein
MGYFQVGLAARLAAWPIRHRGLIETDQSFFANRALPAGAAMYQQAIRELNERFRRQIPMTDHLGLKISAWDGTALRMEAPLEANLNDKGTGFAGSIASLATFAGWALITLAVEEHFGVAEVAIYRSEIRYRRPIDGDFHALCQLPEESELADFWQALRQTGKGRLELAVTVGQNDEARVRFQGAYAVRLV